VVFVTDYSTSLSQVAQQYRDSSNLSARQRIYRFGKPGRSWQHWVFDQLQLTDDAKVLELGCGNATLWKMNGERLPSGWEITLSDASAGMIEAARQTVGSEDARFSFARFDAQTIPFSNASFDALIANHMLYHVPDRDRAIGEARRVLGSRGVFYATTNGAEHMKELRELIDRFVPSAWQETGVMVGTPFVLETGGAELSRHFGTIELLRPTAAELRVTEAQAIVDYALSIERAKPILVGETLAAFRAAVQDVLDLEGAFRIMPSTGMFRATG
jgi:ubiquinone/menaquinone biosynthesis C-methylase UbiE